MRHFTSLYALGSIGLAACALLTGCTTQNANEEPEPCTTTAIVQFCNGRTAMCLTEHTALKLVETGLILHPKGAVWQAYLPKQVDGQVLRISYEIIPRLTYDNPGYESATLSCLETIQSWCGTN